MPLKLNKINYLYYTSNYKAYEMNIVEFHTWTFTDEKSKQPHGRWKQRQRCAHNYEKLFLLFFGCPKLHWTKIQLLYKCSGLYSRHFLLRPLDIFLTVHGYLVHHMSIPHNVSICRRRQFSFAFVTKQEQKAKQRKLVLVQCNNIHAFFC